MRWTTPPPRRPRGSSVQAAGIGGRAWSPSDRWEFDHVAGDLLVELGYKTDRSWSQLPAQAARVRHGTAAASFVTVTLRRAGQLLMEQGASVNVQLVIPQHGPRPQLMSPLGQTNDAPTTRPSCCSHCLFRIG